MVAYFTVDDERRLLHLNLCNNVRPVFGSSSLCQKHVDFHLLPRKKRASGPVEDPHQPRSHPACQLFPDSVAP